MSEYQEIRDLASKFADSELAPLAAQVDKEARIPESTYQKLGENGFMGVYVPEEHGGAGMDYSLRNYSRGDIESLCFDRCSHLSSKFASNLANFGVWQ